MLFTRAKKRIVVFSSLDPERIQTTANSPWGVRALKQYLIFARTGILQQADDGGDQPTNDFERSVGAVLKENGYEIVPQVGVAGFFIDLGVKHPAKAGTFLLGIECDGASYHSGRSARDRDRLRQEILENLGWKIHRVWSTDWFRSRDNEIKRMLRYIEDLLENDPAYKLEKQKANRIEALRQRLVALREEEISASLPGFARRKMLAAHRSTRRVHCKAAQDQGRLVPENSSSSCAAVSIRSRWASILHRVLEIIAECGN